MDKRDRICDKALELFLRDGYEQTPLSRVAKALGLSKAGLYHYFSSKEELLFQIHERQMERTFIPVLEKAEKIADPTERVAFFMREYILHAMTQDPSVRVVVHETQNLARTHRARIDRVWRRGFDLIRNALLEMKAAGKAKDVNMTFATFGALGMCSWIFYWFDYSRQESARELADTYVEIFLRGLSK
ncbi:TetR/AcrR family transcriptional regulator [Desulfatiglans anilini]|uniref:TetR/AcrR family transcriptional regulator n=1 Tax=Desulfatiglans anilini TaxID=90728 RepID=UPI00040FD520|nr:TetR/AcrR family transcriptional regulator [Desulfatiglans anilini]